MSDARSEIRYDVMSLSDMRQVWKNNAAVFVAVVVTIWPRVRVHRTACSSGKEESMLTLVLAPEPKKLASWASR